MSVHVARDGDRIGRRSAAERKKGSRRLALLRKAGLFGGDAGGAQAVRATSVEDLLTAYRLVHDAFVEKGYIHRQASGLRMRTFEALPTTATFVAKADGKVVGVQSLAMDDPQLGLPSDQAFQADLDALRGKGRVLCEATNEAVDPDWRRTSVPTELMRCCFAHALAKGCTDLITTVSPGHVRFYELLGFEQVSEVRSYSAKIEDPVAVVRFDLSALGQVLQDIEQAQDEVEVFLKKYYVDENPYGRHVGAWDVVAERLFGDVTLLRVLFVNESGLLPNCTEAELEAIRRHWGAETMAAVLPAEETACGQEHATRPTGPIQGTGVENRSMRLVRQIAEELAFDFSSEQAVAAAHLISREIDEAVTGEREACAQTVSRHLHAASYHPRGLVGAIRERSHTSRSSQQVTWKER